MTPRTVPIHVDRHDSPLGRWTLARCAPPEMAGLVDGVWYFEGEMTRRRERHLPFGVLDLVVHLGPVYGHVEGARVETYPASCITGLLLGSDVIEAPRGPSAVLGIRLHPAGAYALLGRPMHELAGCTADLRDVMPDAADRLADRCNAAADPESRVRAAVGWLRTHLRPDALDPAVAWTARQIEARAGAVAIRDLVDRTGWSRTRLTTRFREQIGVTPKVLARVRRFRRAVEMLNAGEEATEIAFACGYHDQPHLIHEFRALCGFTPGAYAELVRFPDSPSIAESAG